MPQKTAARNFTCSRTQRAGYRPPLPLHLRLFKPIQPPRRTPARQGLDAAVPQGAGWWPGKRGRAAVPMLMATWPEKIPRGTGSVLSSPCGEGGSCAGGGGERQGSELLDGGVPEQEALDALVAEVDLGDALVAGPLDLDHGPEAERVVRDPIPRLEVHQLAVARGSDAGPVGQPCHRRLRRDLGHRRLGPA